MIITNWFMDLTLDTPMNPIRVNMDDVKTTPYM
ncbi:unnamed protein product, partial [marine sediment metagenome]